MKLVASMMLGEREFDRYASDVLGHLLEFCDEVRVRAETTEAPALNGMVGLGDGIEILWREPSFFQHEGRARQELLDFTLEGKPTHVLAIDADEFVTDGPKLRRFLETARGNVFTLSVTEIWKADEDWLWARVDGGWNIQESPICWRVPTRQRLQINQRQLMCGREPTWVRNQRQRQRTDVGLLHFGWTNVADRQARFQRYVDYDGGRFHRNAHIQSIMWGDDKVKLTRQPWPTMDAGRRARVLERANRSVDWVMPTDEGIVRDSVTKPIMDWDSNEGVTFDEALHAQIWRHPGGRWVRIGWDGTIEHGGSPGPV